MERTVQVFSSMVSCDSQLVQAAAFTTYYVVSVFDGGMFAVEIANALIIALPPKVKRRQAATP